MTSPILENYLEAVQKDCDDITYEIYCHLLTDTTYLDEDIITYIRNLRLTREWINIFRHLKRELDKIAKDFKINYLDIVKSFQNKDVYNFLKAFRFNIRLILRGFTELSAFFRSGLLAVFKSIYRTKAIQKLRSGALKVDEFLNRYPLLKKIGGLAIAALLLYIWLNMTFIGDLDYDFNFSDIVGALKGSFSIADLFVSPSGLMLVTLFGSGAALGLSMPWLGKKAYNLILAIFYTTYDKVKGNKDILKRVQRKLPRFR
jgi:hypothetical protein